MKKSNMKKNSITLMTLLMLMISTSLMANSTAATTAANEKQSIARVAIEFGILLLFILFPLFIKRRSNYSTPAK